MPEVSFPLMEWVDVEDSIKGSEVSSLDEIELLIELDIDGNDVEPLMTGKEEVEAEMS